MTESVEQRLEYSPDLLYKFLDEDGVSPIAGAAWALPGDEGPGEWMEPVANIVVCKRGYHLCREQDLLGWTSSPALYVAEGRGERLDADNKVVYESARLLYRVDAWNRRIQTLRAADCAEHVLHIFEEYYPDDMRPRRAIETVRAYLVGEASEREVRTAYATASAAIRVCSSAGAARAARDAAAAAYLYNAAACTDNAAFAAASAAAKATDFDNASSHDTASASDAWKREREWQLERLLEYLWPEREGEK